MSKFSLDNHVEKVEKPIPIWAQSSPTTRKLYLCVVRHGEKIEELIKNTPKKEVADIPIKARKIVASAVTEEFRLDRSNISERKVPKLVEYIKTENNRLNQLWKNACVGIGSGKRPKRDELEESLASKERELKEQRQKNLHDYFNESVKSEVLNSQRDLANQLNEVRNLYKLEQEKSNNQDLTIKQLIRELNTPK
ncbi:hypothetical protein JEU11_03730 [Paraglaciecola chathamensis]|uniref:Uncharacterized protein n=1 Tax=Paraglaciecola chathamensis TaxID=368405 RepID=A0ABS0WAR4_9ALTE|nr:hypothetical protein [Paraglaciecola chathamensis]MBJ2135554.1 hypothetical protein [Paraglaciecola chathamensis]